MRESIVIRGFNAVIFSVAALKFVMMGAPPFVIPVAIIFAVAAVWSAAHALKEGTMIDPSPREEKRRDS